MDEITRNSLPYYENQLRTSLDIIESLSEQISNFQEEENEIVVKVHDGSMETWQILSDIDLESEEVIQELEYKNQLELEEYKDLHSQQDKQLLELHQVDPCLPYSSSHSTSTTTNSSPSTNSTSKTRAS